MTCDELRDRLAKLCGWEQQPDLPDWWFRSNGEASPYHPFPDNDLTALAKAWPEGWMWERFRLPDTNILWEARKVVNGEVVGRATQLDSENEWLDRLVLTVAVLEHERGAGGGKGTIAAIDAGRGGNNA